ncbi:Oxoglutarate/iron-dependent dioxygenase [Sesbania bispinosa]|nr:Oxoglutarate/iron-dependent dioxygenase [Sesbania bispinosa]
MRDPAMPMELLSSLNKQDILEVLSDSDAFCQHCQALVHARIRSLHKRKRNENSYPDEESESFSDAVDTPVNGNASNSESLTTRLGKQWHSPGNSLKRHESTPSTRDNKRNFDSSPKYLGDCKHSDSELLLDDGICEVSSLENELSEEQKELIRYSQVHSKKYFTYIERVNGRDINVLQGLELHTGVFNVMEQNKIVEYIYRLQWRGKQGKLRGQKWKPPGIIRDEEVDPLPPVFKQMIKRMVRWNIVPPTCIPDSCIVNIYDVGDCIPPHIDHHDFVRPFYTVSFLNECKIMACFHSLPVGSVFNLSGNGADVAKHCIPSVSSRRISITFRKMDESKLPYKFSPDPELVGIKPLIISRLKKPVIQHGEVWNLEETQQEKAQSVESDSSTVWKTRKILFPVKDEFSPLNGSFRKLKVNKFGRRTRQS